MADSKKTVSGARAPRYFSRRTGAHVTSPTGTSSSTSPPDSPLARPSGWRDWSLPALALIALGGALLLTPGRDLSPGSDLPIERFAHNLGHAINSAWVVVSLAMLVLPSLWQWLSPAGRRARPAWAMRAALAIALEGLLVDGVGKRMLHFLSRPYAPGRPGFPSGHATFAFALAWLIWKRYPKLGLPWFVMAALISWSRAEVIAHFPYQVFGGALIGTGIGALMTSRRVAKLLGDELPEAA